MVRNKLNGPPQFLFHCRSPAMTQRSPLVRPCPEGCPDSATAENESCALAGGKRNDFVRLR